MLLSDGWRAAVADDDLRRTYYDEGFDDRGWEPITVPGHWRSHPAFAGSDGPLLHRCRFDGPAPEPGRRAWLTFDGLFYQGDHWLDGTYLGDTEGYFMPHTFEVTDHLRARAEHTLALEVTCAPQTDSTSKRNLTGVFQHWDCLDPDWNPGGIWRPVRLTETGPVRIARLRVLCREADAERAVVAFHAELDADEARAVRIRTMVGGVDHGADRSLAAGSNVLDWTVTVERPALWWPRALGDPTLHDVHVAVHLAGGDPDADAGRADGTATSPSDSGEPTGPGALSDERRLRIGLREVRLRNWVCSVNGERLFLKGSNQGPTRMALGEATPEEVRRDVTLAVETGLDFLRVHGHIGRQELYDAADEAGLLLWQDMPLQWGYSRTVRRQATRQARAAVDLLGHHPSILLWCGHNDPVAARDLEPPVRWGERLRIGTRLVTGHQLPTWNKTVLDASLKRTLERADGTRPVVPHSGVPPHLPRLDGTDSHLYFGWYYGDERQLPAFCRALPRMARFVSELGAQAVPSGEGAAFMEPERWPDLDWERLGHTHGLQKTGFDRYVPPDGYSTFEAWQAATQRYQATVIKHQVEALRRLKYRPTGGFAQFCFADGHPSVTWSVLGHDRQPKLGLAALREACRPVIAVADRPPATVRPGEALALDIHVVSDRRDEVDDAELTATLAWSGGDHGWRWTGGVPADACVRVGTLQVVVPDAPGPLELALDLRLPDGEVVTNHYASTITAFR
jgi:beta-mannosidase